MGCYRKGERWYIDYYLVDGKRKREAVTIEGRDPATITLRNAQKALSIRKAEQSQGKFDIAKTLKPVKFEVLVESYLKWTEEHHKRQDRDRVACKSLLAHFSGSNVYSITL